MHDPGQSAGMVHLRMIADHIINFFGVDDLSNAVQKVIGEFLFDRVDQGHFFIQDQIGVIGGTLRGGMPMKFPQVPIDSPNPKNIFNNFYRFHNFYLAY